MEVKVNHLGGGEFKHNNQYVKGSCRNEGVTRGHVSGEQSSTYAVGGAVSVLMVAVAWCLIFL
jgi:hypothetical protein